MIKVLSPYYIAVPYVNPTTEVVCEFFTLEVYIYTGLKNQLDPPLIYSKTIKNPEALETSIKIDISNFASEYVPINGACWVKAQVYYSDSPIVQLGFLKLASKGYTYGIEAQNQEVDGILTTGLEHKIGRNQTFVLKILAEESTPPTALIEIVSITETTAPDYDLVWDCNYVILTIIYSYREVGDLVWIDSAEQLATNPLAITLTLTSGDYEVKIRGIDITTGIDVTSDIFEITI